MGAEEAAGAQRMEPVVLRPARTADMFLLVELADQVGFRLNPEWIRARLRADPDAEAHVVAILHDLPVGAAHVQLPSEQRGDGIRARITALTVDEHHRAGRVGSRLLAHCEELAGRMGASIVKIAVPYRSHDLQGFWRRNGYECGDSAAFVKRLGGPSCASPPARRVRSADDHARCDDIRADDAGQQRLPDRADPVPPAGPDPPDIDLVEGHGDSVEARDVGEGLAVPGLPVVPQGHERAGIEVPADRSTQDGWVRGRPAVGSEPCRPLPERAPLRPTGPAATTGNEKCEVGLW